MSTPRKQDWEFPISVAQLATELGISPSRIHNAMPPLGIRTIEKQEDITRILFYLFNKGANARSLIKVFGSGTTLGQLAQLEESIA